MRRELAPGRGRRDFEGDREGSEYGTGNRDLARSRAFGCANISLDQAPRVTSADPDAGGVLGVIAGVLLFRRRPVFRTRLREAVQWRGSHEHHGRQECKERATQHAGRVVMSDG